MVGRILDEWGELSADFSTLETTKKCYLEKLEETHNVQKACLSMLTRQKYHIEQLKADGAYVDNVDGIQEKILKREVKLQQIEQTLPKENDTYLKIILGNVNVSILNRDDTLKYKSEYENFKLVFSVVAFVFAILNLYYVSRFIERIYLFLLVWYYCTLTIRESILKINGSKIKGWWRLHHFLSMATAAILLIWPESDTWNEFRVQFMIFNAYLSIVQYLQFRYQTGVLYRLKALGERHNMDITIEGFHSWMWRGLSFLFPFLFIVYFFQFYMAISLYRLSYLPGATWHVKVLAILFLILSVGNFTTIIMIIPNKITNNVKLKYHIFSQRLSSPFLSSDPETDKNENEKNK